MPKAKNEGRMLCVKVSLQTHAQIAKIKARMIEEPWMPMYLTSAYVVEEAVAGLFKVLEMYLDEMKAFKESVPPQEVPSE